MPIHLYDWEAEWPGQPRDVHPHTLWEYLADNPMGWPNPDLTFLYAIIASDRDTLYLGGGSGRMAKNIERVGNSCHCIDSQDTAIELMTLKGVSCEKMDANAMTFPDNSYPLVVVAPGVLDVSPDPEALLTRAAEICSERLITAGWTLGPEPVDVQETITWQGESEDRNSKAYPPGHILQMMENAGMELSTLVEYLGHVDRDELFWVIEAKW